MYPFSELVVGDKFTLEDDDIIRVKTGATVYRLTGDAYQGDGEIPKTLSEESGELTINPSTKVRKMLDLIALCSQIQHEIWELSVNGNESYSEVLNRVIAETAEDQDDIVHRIAVLIRNARNEGHDGVVFE